MKEFRDFKDIKEAEQRLRKEYKTTLESLSGFSRLSENQKRYLLNSLYIQQRAERGTDIVSAAHINEMPKKFEEFAQAGPYILTPEQPKKVPSEGKYSSSQSYVSNENCHNAIVELEKYRNNKKLLIPEWHEYGLFKSYLDLEKFIVSLKEKNGPPFVIEIWNGKPDKRNSKLSHSTLLIEQNNEGEWMLWEKSGFSMPFQLISLKAVYKAYGKTYWWLVRPLLV